MLVAPRPAGAGRRRPAAGLGDHALEPAPRADRGSGRERREDVPGRPGTCRATRRSSSRSARWATSWSRWCASRWTRSGAATSSSACGCRRWTIRSTGSTATCTSRSPSSPTTRRALEWGMHMNLAARALERVGDNAVDIGEQVVVPGVGRVPRVHRRLPSRRRRPRCRLTAPGSSSSRTRSPSRTRSATTSSARATRSRWRPTGAGRSSGSAPTRPSLVILDLMLPGGLGPRRVPDDPDRVRRPHHHGHREGLGGRQGHRARARRRRLRHQAVLDARARLARAGEPAPDQAPRGPVPGRRGPRRGAGPDGRGAPRGGRPGRTRSRSRRRSSSCSRPSCAARGGCSRATS